MEKVPGELRDKLGIAVAKRTYKAYRRLLDSERWLKLANAGARPQRLLWASTGTKDPTASDVLYIKALAAPFTVNTIPDKTLLAFADHGSVDELTEAMPRRRSRSSQRRASNTTSAPAISGEKPPSHL